MATSSSSTSSNSEMSFLFDVFLSFRGVDTRKTFVDNLYYALQGKGIHTFKDDEDIDPGKRIERAIMDAIEDSRLYVIVFSENYADSSWCLDELVKIMEECHKTPNHIAIPVFYDVSPSDVSKQQGDFGKAFEKHNEEDMEEWRTALVEAGNDVSGIILEDHFNGFQGKCIKKIEEKISEKLRSLNAYIDMRVIGMKYRLKKVLSSFETRIHETCMIGIKGTGGIGKTTLARAIFNKKSSEFEGISFLEDVGGVSDMATLSGLKALQQQLLLDIFNKDYVITGVDHGKNMIKRMMNKKVLIVLDGVNNKEQLEALVDELNWFKAGSRIIITTRDVKLLEDHGVKIIHEIDLLSDDEAICLFKRHAFGSDIPTQEFEDLSHEIVRYAHGLPLTIRDLGDFLCGKDEPIWTDLLKKLKTRPFKKTMDRLKLSCVGLEEYIMEIFLDIACFLKRLQTNDALRILECCHEIGLITGLDVLKKKSLITISRDQCLGMHESIQEMGKDIVFCQYPHSLNERSRLWYLKEIEEIVADGSGTGKTRAIAGNDSYVQLNSAIVNKGFGNMTNLKFVCLVSDTNEDDCSPLDESSQIFPRTLRYLSWELYPHRSLPKTFQPDNLVALEMSECRIVQLWEGEQEKVLNNLKFLVLSRSKLRSLDLSLTPNLKELNLEDCQELEALHTSKCLDTLVSLNLTGCEKISSLLFIKSLESLKFLRLTLLQLKKFPDIIANHSKNSLLELQFGHNNIAELPESIINLQKLIELDLKSCRKLRSLPQMICYLQNLRNLELSGCSSLEELPSDINHLGCLENLSLSHALVKCLPDSICKLKNLKTLDLSFCRNLENLPTELGQLKSLQELILSECRRLKDIPDSICDLKCLKCFSLLNCIRLEKLPENFESLDSLKELIIEGSRIRIPKLPPNTLLKRRL